MRLAAMAAAGQRRWHRVERIADKLLESLLGHREGHTTFIRRIAVSRRLSSDNCSARRPAIGTDPDVCDRVVTDPGSAPRAGRRTFRRAGFVVAAHRRARLQCVRALDDDLSAAEGHTVTRFGRRGATSAGAVGVLAALISLVLINGANATAPKSPDAPTASSGGVANAGFGAAGPGSTANPNTASPYASPPVGYPITGIDVSSWQGTVDWATVAKTAKFAYVKATEGTTYLSATFAAQYSGAKAAGLLTGAYAFARPNTPAVAQADYFIDHANVAADGKTLPPMLDLEWPYKLNGAYIAPYPCYGLSPTAMVAWIRAFVTEVSRRTGSPTLIYTAANWWNQCTGGTTTFADQPLAVASFSSTPPTTLPTSWSSWSIWQYAASGSLPGDQDVFNGTLTQLKAMTVGHCGAYRLSWYRWCPGSLQIPPVRRRLP
jgi:GH25 family lysozyme M1 (1,4-beta-N-acetylmuramidase)